MVKVFYLGLFAAIISALAALTLAVPVGTVPRNSSVIANQPQSQEAILSDDSAIRSERSTNLSHITGSARKIQMYVKNRHLQILPDGTVNGTSDDTSDYTILQRTTVSIGQLKIQGVATCQFLCMDSCGLLYGSKEFLDECIFNEMIEQHHYNTYSSARYSNKRRTMYLALNRRGQPRKVQIRANQQLGKLSTYTRVLTKPVNTEVLEDMLTRLLHHNSQEETSSSHPLRHHGGHLCATISGSTDVTKNQRNKNINTSAGESAGIDKLRCRKRKKRKKKRRKCEIDENAKGCLKPVGGVRKNKECEHDKDNIKCQRLDKSVLVTVKKKRKMKLEERQLNQRNVKRNGKKQLKKVKKLVRGKQQKVTETIFTNADDNFTMSPTTIASDEENSNSDESTTVTIDNSEPLCDEVISTTSISESSTSTSLSPDA